MQFKLLPLVLLVALASLVDGDPKKGKGVIKHGRGQQQTQIEAPPVDNEMDGLDDLEDFAEANDYDDEDLPDYSEDIDETLLDSDGDGIFDANESDEDEGELEERVDPFDIDYQVDRPTDEKVPTHPDLDKEEGKILDGDVVYCEDIDDDGDDDGDDDDDEEEHHCIHRPDQQKNWRPYANYKGYNKWKRQPLFVIIIGGLRWDYLNGDALNMTAEEKSKLKAFNWIRRHGTTMKQVIPVYPPLDLPTWTSMATGLYPVTTGVLGDYMYDLKTRKLYEKFQSLEGWWVKGEPIWSVAAKHNRKVSVLNWHDCKLPGTSIENPNDCKPFNPRAPIPTKQKLTQLLNQAFTKIHAGGYDLSVVYTDALKKTALRFGPNSREVAEQLATIDDVLQGRLSDIKNKKERVDLKLNILLLSDYGLAGKENTTKYVLDDYINFDDVQYIIQRGGSVVLVPYALKSGGLIFGVEGKIGLEAMPGVDAFVRDKNLETPPLVQPIIPEDLKYSGYSWTQDILIIARPGFEIEINDGKGKLLPPMNMDLEMGTAAYHPNPKRPHIVPGREKHKSKELRAREKLEMKLYENFAHMMKTVGFAWGPDFKVGHETDEVEVVDIYQLMAFLLQVDPNPHDGHWDRVKGMLMLSGSESFTALPIMIISLAVTSFLL